MEIWTRTSIGGESLDTCIPDHHKRQLHQLGGFPLGRPAVPVNAEKNIRRMIFNLCLFETMSEEEQVQVGKAVVVQLKNQLLASRAKRVENRFGKSHNIKFSPLLVALSSFAFEEYRGPAWTEKVLSLNVFQEARGSHLESPRPPSCVSQSRYMGTPPHLPTSTSSSTPSPSPSPAPTQASPRPSKRPGQRTLRRGGQRPSSTRSSARATSRSSASTQHR